MPSGLPGATNMLDDVDQVAGGFVTLDLFLLMFLCWFLKILTQELVKSMGQNIGLGGCDRPKFLLVVLTFFCFS